MKKKLLSLILVFSFLILPLMAESSGVASFFSSVGKVLITIIVVLILGAGFVGIASDSSSDSSNDDVYFGLICFFGVIGAIAGNFIFPGIFASFFGALLVVILGFSYVVCGENGDGFLVSTIALLMTIGLVGVAKIYLPESWGVWKYFSIAILGVLLANALAGISLYRFTWLAFLIEGLLVADEIFCFIYYSRYGFDSILLTSLIVFASIIILSFILLAIMKSACKSYAEIRCSEIAEKILIDPDYLENLSKSEKIFYNKHKKTIEKINEKKKIDEVNKNQENERIKREFNSSVEEVCSNIKKLSNIIAMLQNSDKTESINIMLLKQIEETLSILVASKKNMTNLQKKDVKRQKAYFKSELSDCKKLKSFTSSVKVRMQEILNQFDDVLK